MDWRITKGEDGQRADKIVASRLGISRTKAQRLFVGALLDGKICTPHTLVKEGQTLILASDASPLLPSPTPPKTTNYSNPHKLPPTPPPPSSLPSRPTGPLDILFEDNDVLVVNKPAGLLTHAAASAQGEESLTDLLVEHVPAMREVGDPLRPGIVHRLDRDVSGVLIAAKHAQAFHKLKQQFQKRKAEKCYLALVEGAVSKTLQTIRFPLVRKKDGRMAARPEGHAGREAVTHVTVINRFHHLTLVEVRIETGRTHQIRAHLSAIGHPVVGDTLYGHTKKTTRLASNRLFLHAVSLAITLPDGSHPLFTAPLPSELTETLTSLLKARSVPSRCFVLTGPSGVGKTTLMKLLIQHRPLLQKILTTTTRKPRPGEKDGVDYHFVSKKSFEEGKKKREWFESAEVYGSWYGNRLADVTDLQKAKRDVLIMLDIQGAATFQQTYKDASVLCLMPDKKTDLRQRLEHRAATKPEEITARLEALDRERAWCKEHGICVVNHEGDLSRTLKNLLEQIAE